MSRNGIFMSMLAIIFTAPKIAIGSSLDTGSSLEAGKKSKGNTNHKFDATKGKRHASLRSRSNRRKA